MTTPLFATATVKPNSPNNLFSILSYLYLPNHGIHRPRCNASCWGIKSKSSDTIRRGSGVFFARQIPAALRCKGNLLLLLLAVCLGGNLEAGKFRKPVIPGAISAAPKKSSSKKKKRKPATTTQSPPAEKIAAPAPEPPVEAPPVEPPAPPSSETAVEEKESAKESTDGQGPPEQMGDGRFVHLSLGVNFIFPNAQLFIHIYRHLAFSGGATLFSYPSDAGKMSGRGFHGALNYFGEPSFGGLWFQLGVGKNLLTIEQGGSSETFPSLSAQISFGWRWTLLGHLNFGFGVGANYLQKTKETLDIGISGLFPAIEMDLGLSF